MKILYFLIPILIIFSLIIFNSNKIIAHNTNIESKNMNINEYVDIFNKDKNGLLLDVRTIDEVKEGKIPNSKNIPLDKINNTSFDKNLTIYR